MASQRRAGAWHHGAPARVPIIVTGHPASSNRDKPPASGGRGQATASHAGDHDREGMECRALYLLLDMIADQHFVTTWKESWGVERE
jgi:hypothetical protein